MTLGIALHVCAHCNKQQDGLAPAATPSLQRCAFTEGHALQAARL